MHACGVAHGDLKMANVLKTGEAYKLADLPALTRATTKMLTSDPVVSTRITSGRRMLSNDMWGLGLVSITLLAGTTAFRKVCEKFKAIAPEAGDAAAMWLIFAAGFLTALATYSRRMLPPNAERDEHLGAIGAAQKTFIQSVTGRQMIKRLHRKHREEVCVCVCMCMCVCVCDGGGKVER
jgi:serine/threonine protein kinase